MAFEDTFRLSAHAVIMNNKNEVLQLKATYGECRWGLPGGALEPSETIHEALHRECKEEMGVDIAVKYLSGVYFHSLYNSHAFIFLCELSDVKEITLSSEHSDFRYFPLSDLSHVQRKRVTDCLEYRGAVVSDKF